MNTSDNNNPTVSRHEFESVLASVAQEAAVVKQEPKQWNVSLVKDTNNVKRKQYTLVVDDPNSPLPEVQKFEPNLSTDPSAFYQNAQDALDAIKQAKEDFASQYGMPNLPLIQAKQDVARLEKELREAKQKLAELEEQGDSVCRFSTAVLRAEAAFRGLKNMAQVVIGNSIMRQMLGHVLPTSKRDGIINAVIKSHKRTMDLHATGSGFVQDLPNNPSKELLESRAATAASQIEKLVAYMRADEQANK